MNNDLSLDPGFLIAYLILGTLAVVLLAPSVPALCVSFSAVRDGSATGGATFIFSVSCFAYGMMISALRGSTLDCTFRLNLKRFLPFQRDHYVDRNFDRGQRSMRRPHAVSKRRVKIECVIASEVRR
jgi:hypothetical protein